MKKITKEINVTKEKEIYVAEDGTEFESRVDCLLHERGILYKKFLKKHATDNIKKEITAGLPDSSITTTSIRPTTDGVPVDIYPYVHEGWYWIDYDNRDYNWIKISDEEDIEAVKLICGGDTHDLEIGKWICLEYDPSDEEGWTWELSGTIKEMADFLKWFGYGIVKLEGTE